MSEVTLNIGGMTCINCQSKIENALNVAEGIKAARVNWKNSWAKIEYDKDKINVKEIKKIIEDLDLIGKVDQAPKLEGRQMSMMLSPV